MNTMKKQLITLACCLLVCLPVWAQKQYKVAAPSGKLYLNLNGVRIEGYTGNEVIFSSQGVPDEGDERAKGLQVLSGSGLIDNTGLGISVTTKGSDIEVNHVGRTTLGDVLSIRVPNTVDVVFNNNTATFADTVLIKDMKGELEISSSYNDIVLVNNSGPMNVKNLYSNVEVTFADDIKGPVSIVSVYGLVDVAMPTATKASLMMSTSYGKLYAARDFDVLINNTSAKKERVDNAGGEGIDSILPDVVVGNGQVVVSSASSSKRKRLTAAGIVDFGLGESIEGTINGGGIDLILQSTYKNVYLRAN